MDHFWGRAGEALSARMFAYVVWIFCLPPIRHNFCQRGNRTVTHCTVLVEGMWCDTRSARGVLEVISCKLCSASYML
eukprot:4153422-Pyramimonas_sp.AAC.1